jgi:hypothetical protein
MLFFAETPTLLWCSVPPCRRGCARRHHLRFVSRSITISQLYRSGRTSSFTIQSSTVLIFPYELLQQELTSWSNDGGHKDDSGSFWLGDRNGNGNHMGLSRRPRGLSNAVSPRGRIRTCPSFLTHYIRYYGIKRQITCVSRLTATAKAFSRTRNLSYPGCGLIKLVFEV